MDQTPMQRFTSQSEPLWQNFGELWWESVKSILFNDFSWTTEAQWKRITGWVNRMVKVQFPKLGHFHQAASALSIYKPKAQGFSCNECKGRKGKEVYLKERTTGIINPTWEQCWFCVIPNVRKKIGGEALKKKIEESRERFEEVSAEEYFRADRHLDKRVPQPK